MASENCAVDADSKLKDANDIRWYNSGDDETPITPATGKLRPNDRASITTGPSSKSGLGILDIYGNIDPTLWKL